MASLLKRSASPSIILPSRKRSDLNHSLVVPCNQQFCQCDKVSSLILLHQGQGYVLHLNDVEILNFYVKVDLDLFVPIHCFLNIVAEFVKVQVAENVSRKADFGSLLNILHPRLAANAQFIELLEEYKIFSVLENEIVQCNLQYNGNSSSGNTTGVVLALKALYWFAAASPTRLFQSQKILTKLTEFINVFLDEISEVTLESIKILCELSRSHPQLIPVIMECSYNQDLLDIITKNIAMSANIKVDFFYGNVYLFKQFMQHRSCQERAAEYGCIELLFTIYENKWDTDFFDILNLVLTEPIYSDRMDNDGYTVAGKIILRNSSFLDFSWQGSATNRAGFLVALKNIKFRSTKDNAYIKEIIAKVEA